MIEERATLNIERATEGQLDPCAHLEALALQSLAMSPTTSRNCSAHSTAVVNTDHGQVTSLAHGTLHPSAGRHGGSALTSCHASAGASDNR